MVKFNPVVDEVKSAEHTSRRKIIGKTEERWVLSIHPRQREGLIILEDDIKDLLLTASHEGRHG